MSLEYPESGTKKDPLEPAFVHYSGHVEDDIQISALDVFYQVDGRESRQIKEVSDWFREEDAGDLKSSELNEYMTRRNAFEGKIGKICLRKSWKSVRSTQNIVMNEEFVKHSVVKAKIDPKCADECAEDAIRIK